MSAVGQSRYQVRFDWGVEGANAIAPGAHVLVWVDALPTEDIDSAALAHDGAIVTGSIGSRVAVADWVLARQTELGDRVYVAVVAAGGPNGRFAVEDLVAAGAIIDALADAGLDFSSPEAAAAMGAYAGLRNAGSHVLSASVTGQELMEAGASSQVDAARAANASAEFTVLRELGAP